MKKIMIGLLMVCSMNAFAQLSLKDDSVTFKDEKPNNGILSSEKFKELNGFTKYSGTIQGFSGYCQYPAESQKIFYDNYMRKIANINLSKDELEIITNSFKQTAYEIKKNGINGLSCDKFKPDFEKIIKDIKQ